MQVTKCSSQDCGNKPTESLRVAGHVGHVHDCPEHTHDLREWIDITDSRPIVDGECTYPECTGDAWYKIDAPTPLT